MSLQGFHTTKGLALAAKAAAGAGLTVTKVTAGSGATATSAAVLADEKQTLTVGPAQTDGQTATLPVTLAEARAGVSYALTELGVYASDPDAGEILYQVFRLDESRAIRAGGESVYRFYLRESVGADGVTVSCSPAGLLIDEDLAPTRSKVLAAGVPTRTVSLAASELRSYITHLPRLLIEDLRLTVNGTVAEHLPIANFFGSGSIRIVGHETDGCIMQGGVAISAVSVPVAIGDCTIYTTNGRDAVHAEHAKSVLLNNCSMPGDGTGRAIDVGYGSRVELGDCSMTNHSIAAMASHNSTIAISTSNPDVVFSGNTTGAYVYHGGIILLCDKTPELLGAAANGYSGGLIVNAQGAMI